MPRRTRDRFSEPPWQGAHAGTAERESSLRRWATASLRRSTRPAPWREVLPGINAQVNDDLTATGGAAMLDRLPTPPSRLGSKRFLREARHKGWHNTLELQNACLAGPQQYAVRLAELGLFSAAKIANLLQPNLLQPSQFLLRLAVAGFGLTLPLPDSGVAGAQTLDDRR